MHILCGMCQPFGDATLELLMDMPEPKGRVASSWGNRNFAFLHSQGHSRRFDCTTATSGLLQ